MVNAGPGSAEHWRECLFFCSFHGPFFYHSESSSNEPVRILREFWSICLFTPGFVVSLDRDFLFRAAWTLPTPQVQHKGFDAMAWLGACSQHGRDFGSQPGTVSCYHFFISHVVGRSAKVTRGS